MSTDDRADELVYAFRRNLVVAASAGTGKTHRLTGLYAMLVLGLSSSGRSSDEEATGAVAPSRIVATTFSRAAAREIADRAASSLEGVAAAGDGLGRHDAAIRSRLARLHDPPSREELRTRARRALGDMLTARIDTVHGLAARMVAEHAVDLGLPPAARILDEGESAELDALVVDETLHAALDAGGASADAARALLDTCGGLAPARTEVAALLARLDEEGAAPEDLERGDHLGAAARLLRDAREVAARVEREGSERLRAPAGAALAQLARAGLGAPDPAALEQALIAWFSITVRRGKPADEALIELREQVGKGTNAERGRVLAQLLVHAPELVAREAQIVGLLEGARVRLRRERDARRALSFGDVLRLARDGLRDRPSIAGRARASLDALLVDEFQDTSPVQRDLVLLLRERPEAARARGHAPPETSGVLPAGLFLVGDRKQSIYGFRGADVAVFARLCAELAGVAAASALDLPRELAREPAVADFVSLRASHRSGERLCAFVNQVAAADFGEGAASRDFEVRYGAAERLMSAVERPHDEVLLARDDGRDLTTDDAFAAAARGPLRAALTAAALVDGELLAAHGARGVAVLCRRRSSIPLVELALQRRGIPYVVAGRALFDAIEVRDLAALLRLLLDPRERRALATVLRGPAGSLSDDALVALSLPGRGLDADLVFGRGAAVENDALLADDDRARLIAFRGRFASARPALLRMPPADAVREAVRAFEIDVAMAALPRAAARLGNLERIEALARGRGGGLSAFSRHLEAQIASETDGEEAVVFSDDDDAVRVTTIHASKGLDFDAVVLLDLDASTALRAPGLGLGRVGPRLRLLVRHRGTGGSRIASPVFSEVEEEMRAREQAERRRLSYVGLTRARDRLVLVMPVEGEERKPKSGSLHATLGTLGEALLPLVARTLDAATLLETASGPDRSVTQPANDGIAAPQKVATATIATIGLATTPLGTFRECARRFRLRHLLGFDEPVASSQLDLFELPGDDPAPDPLEGGAALDAEEGGEGTTARGPDPRALGRAAHRVLETWPLARWGTAADTARLAQRLVGEGLAPAAAEQLVPGLAAFLGGSFAARAAAAAASVAREHAFVLCVPGDGQRAALEVRGAVDLLVVDDGSAFVIDYKLASPAKDLVAWDFQLRTYALAARARPGVARVHAGVVFLRGGSAEPRWLAGGDGGALSEAEHEAHRRELSALAARFAAARWADRWDGVPKARCDALRCGFVVACHGSARNTALSRGGRARGDGGA